MLGVDERIRIVNAQLAEDLAIRPVPVVAEHRLAPARRELRIVVSERGPVSLENAIVIPLEMDERVVPVEEDRLDHDPATLAAWRSASCGERSRSPRSSSLRATALDVSSTALFILAALALIPLAWLIGEATENASAHTSAGMGGFLNASFGNAPELIIALFAIADGLPLVVRGSIAGSVVSNILLVLGFAMFFGGDGNVDARSLRWQLAGVGAVSRFCLSRRFPAGAPAPPTPTR